MDRLRRHNGLVAGVLASVVAAMVGLSFASVPLYRLFCAATGFGGTPRIGPAASPGADTHMITVRFNADTSPGLPWRFQPERSEIRLPLGEDQVAFYVAHNRDIHPVTGVATYNVTPEKAARYFHKTACFCFDQQTLAAGQDMRFPLSFWVDPAIATDLSTADVGTITLSYTFFRSLDDAARANTASNAGPHVGPLTR